MYILVSAGVNQAYIFVSNLDGNLKIDIPVKIVKLIEMIIENDRYLYGAGPILISQEVRHAGKNG